MNAIQIFDNTQFGQIRVATTENGDPLFCLPDLCRALDLSTPSRVKERLDDDMSLTHPISDSLGRKQATTFVTEPGFYTVVLRSDSPKAKPMQKWVTSEVLPAIRKNGMYASVDTISRKDLAKLLLQSEEEKERLAEINRLHREQVAIAAPKVEYYENVMMSSHTYNTNQIAKELGMSAVSLNRKLKEKGIIYRQSGQWLLYARFQDKGYTKTKTYPFIRADGTPDSSLQTVWTEKGREFIHRLFKD